VTKIILIRHGHVEGIAPERFRGRAELPLTELGRRQAAAAAARIAATWPVAAIYTSPMGRCVETGRAISERTGAPASVTNLLNDLDYGAWTWKTYDEVRTAEPEHFRLWFDAPHLVRFPGGESLQDLVARTADAVRMAIDTHPDETVALVGHDSVNRAMLLQLLDQPLSAYWRLAQSPAAISEIDLAGGRIKVQRINDTAHLDDGPGRAPES
jgi:broad specificity phosphatase PhoE